MKKNYLVVLIAAISLAVGLWVWTGTPNAVAALSPAKWEYGVWRVGGLYRYEWQDADRRIYAETRKIFLEKMNLFTIAVKLEGLTDAKPNTLDYVLDAEFLNYLATQGWELVDVESLVFWFRRRS